MRTFYTIVTLFTFLNAFAQFSQQAQYDDYFLGRSFICENTDPEIKKSMKLGIDCFRLKEYYGVATQIFLKVIKKDSTNCDAHFLAGYSLRLQNRLHEATIFYYIADSLSGNKSYVFKQNLAFTAMATGATTLARKKYTEMTQYFPDSPEGFYGIAATSLQVKDFDNGLKNADIALSKYKKEDKSALYIKGILLTITDKYVEALPYLEKAKGEFKKDDNFKAAYSVCLYKVGNENNDEKKLKEAGKIAKNFERKTEILPELLQKLTF